MDLAIAQRPNLRPEPRKRPRTSRLALLMPDLLEPTLRERGFASATLLAEWAEIVGPALAEFTVPLEIRWPRKRVEAGSTAPRGGRMQEKAEGAVLVVTCASAFALEVQMASGRILDAVNRRLGFRAVTRLEIRQGETPKPRTAFMEREISVELVTAQKAALVDIADDALREALARLGAGIAAKDRKTRL
ncbi:MAG: DciA family protein [Beijerinckiaceae bacterium]|nr:DciA family protein [Beijerinckiaceae bacterium]